MQKIILLKKFLIMSIFVSLISINVNGLVVKDNDIKNISSTIFKGNILNVGGSGPGNYTEIQFAINDANTGDIVYVFDDLSPYYEHVEIDKTIELIGEDKNSTIIDGDGIMDVVYISANGVKVSGFTMQNSGGNWKDAGVDISANNVVVTNNIIKDCCDGINIYENRVNNIISYNTISSTILNGIGVWYSSNNNYILNNNIISNEEHGIELFQCEYNNIINNYISSNDIGIYLSGSDNNFIYDNIFESNNKIGVLIGGSSNFLFNNEFFDDGIFMSTSISENNSVFDNFVNDNPLVFLEHESDMIVNTKAGQIILVNCDNITIKNQELIHTSVGIQLVASSNCLIYDNIISNNYYGLHLGFKDYNYIGNNTIVSNCYGIYSQNQNTKIENNLISKNCHGIHISVGWYNDILNNQISYNNYGLKLDYGSKNNISFNNFIKNRRNIDFIVFFRDKNNNWSDNYWGRQRIFPKLIFGKMRLGNTIFHIPWIFIDRYPAEQPYNIPNI